MTTSANPLAAGPRRVCIAAVGSPHGDDRAGWLAAERLAREQLPGAFVVTLPHPLRLLDHLDGCGLLIVVDGCRTGQAAGAVQRLQWPDAGQAVAGTSGHGFGAAATLALAAALGKLPPEVVVFGIEVGDCDPGSPPGPEVTAAAAVVAGLVRREVTAYRGRTGSSGVRHD